ncbi:dynein axonemal intermediate chain 7 isoform X2 [Trichomycterus rosablanca]|uniref:dynein axonemal intermediate chain 7 isoform X2 n=1 Tax=Trichomycterus rosablanca TaxID=2290929 RepID=UPI002F35DFE2
MSAKKKGGKPSKAEKERLQKELEEQRLKEQEEARLAAEQENQERLEREQKEEEERQRLELKDRERREDELNELHLILEENQKAVNTWEALSKEKAEWDRYMICDGSPDPAVQPEINAFISLWKEDPTVQIQTVLQQCALALRLTEELELLLNEETDSSVAQVYQDTLLSLHHLIHDKIHLATEEILKWTKSCTDIETGNMQTVVQDDNVTLCLWANLNKNPRFKGYHFTEVGLGFELPKQLAVSDIAVRILHTRYDHLSHLSYWAELQNKSPLKEALEQDTILTETPKALDSEEIQKEGEVRESLQQKEDDLQSLKSDGKKSVLSVHSAKSERKSSSLKQGEEVEGHSESIMAFGGGADEADPTPAVVEPVADSAEVHIVDLRQYTPLGGVYYFDVFHLPPQAYTVNGWEIRQILDTGLQVFQYPPEESQADDPVLEKQDESKTHSTTPVGVTIALPESVVFLVEPQIARWDPEGQHWRTDGITEISYNGEEHIISFKMESFYAFTLLQETHINMPFQSWELRPLGENSAMLTITASLTEVSITISGNQCKLQMDQAPELTSILDKWMSFPSLKTAMRRSGVSIFINEYSDKYVAVSTKDPLIEHAVYEQMALLSSAFAFSWSQWNSQCGQEHLVFQACKQLEAGPVPDRDLSLYLLGAQRSQQLKMVESSTEFSPELAEGTEFHSTLLHMLRDTMSPEGRDRVNHVHHLFVETVRGLLFSTRVLTFS